MKNLTAIVFLVLLGCSSKQSSTDNPFHISRPAVHFTPEKNWTNDPNGLVYLDDEYHLFYQYNPYGMKWGHMSWGHAVSSDLIKWKHLPVALEEYVDSNGDSTMIFSGTVVVDKKNTAGFGKDAMVAIYTSHVHRGGQGIAQHQSLAYSNDKGRTWKRYDKNPILDIGRKDFRDPKVFWYEPEEKWVMVVVVPDQFTVQFYDSKNLKNWTKTGEFGHAGDTLRIWECPDIYRLHVESEGDKNYKWVLSLSGSHPQGRKFVGMQYFVGEFDGKTFKPTDPQQEPEYVNYGKDFYAGIVFNQLPAWHKRTVMIGWVNNWTYANEIPATTWRGAMSLPRELLLRKYSNGYRLAQRTIPELGVHPETTTRDFNSETTPLQIEVKLTGPGISGVLIEGDSSSVRIGCDFESQKIFLDRSRSKNFHPDFPSVETAPSYTDQVTSLTVYIDKYITEVFVGDGRVCMTDITFLPKKIHIKPFGKAELKVSEIY